MSSTIHRKLFEVRILHDHYLIAQDGSSLYGLSPADQDVFLADRLSYGQYDMRKDLQVLPTEESKEVMRNYRARLIPTATGFLVGLEVKQVVLSGNSFFFPKIPFAEGFQLDFQLKISNPELINFTSMPMATGFPSRYFFTNADTASNKLYPVISLPVEDYQSTKVYDMGQLAMFGPTLKEANKTTINTIGDWEVNDGKGFVNENDRILLPQDFIYQFEKTGVSTGSFTLKDDGGDTLKVITAGPGTDLQRQRLDFRKTTAGVEIPEDIYTLEIITDQYQYSRQVFLSDRLYDKGNLGHIRIRQNQADGNFSLLESNGSVRESHSVVELRFRNRKVYPEYQSAKGKKLKAEPDTNSLLSEVGLNLRSNAPKPLSATPYMFSFSPDVFLPLSSSKHLFRENGAYYAKVYVEKLDDRIVYGP